MSARTLALATAAATVILVTACAAPDDGAPGGPAGGAADVQSDPVGLIGLWRVSDAEGESPDTWLRLDLAAYQLWRDCGAFVEGGWQAAGRAFVASDPYAAHEACAAEGIGEVSWLRAAVAYEPDGDGWRLLDANSSTVAALHVDGAPDPIPNAAELYAQAPDVTDDLRAALATPAPLPDGLEPATVRDVVGRWEPIGASPTDPHVVFHEDGTWAGSDGCNHAGGAWALDAGGRLLVTAGPQTAIGCDGAAVPSDLAGAARVGLDGDRLVLVDPDGVEITRLVRG